jgi:arylsulfatase A-like enzyme
MMQHTMNKALRFAAAGLGAGLSAGALAGAAEGLSIWAADTAAAASAPLYGALTYPLLLAAPGAALGLALMALARGHEHRSPRWAWTLALIAALTPVAIVVGRFRIVRDLFHEKLALASGAGVAVHLGLLIGGAALAFAIWRLTAPQARGPLHKVAAAPLTAALTLGPIALMAPLLLTAGREPAPIPDTTATQGPVILVMVDTLRADRLSAYGYTKSQTPTLDALAKDAVVFENNFANASWTRPSTASLLTSLPPSAHKTMYKADRLPDAAHTLAEAMKENGYTTGGVVTNYNIAPYFHFAQGFDEYRYLEPTYYFWADEGSSKLSLYNVVRVLREKVAPESSDPNFYYRDAATTTAEAITWMERRKDKPFFLFLTYMDPHDPYFTHPLSNESYSRAANTDPDPKLAARFSELYDGEVRYWDEHFGALIAWLKKEGLYDKVTLAVTSDHGEEFQEHGGWWHGTTLYEEQIHVPLLIKRPAQQGGGERRDDLSSLIDVAPTLLGVVGGQPHASWSGRDLFSDAQPPATVFAEEDHQGNTLRALRSKTWKLIEANPDNPRKLAPIELYHVEQDRAEANNLSDKEPDRVKALQSALDDAQRGVHAKELQRDQMEVDEESQRLLKNLGYAE